MSWSVGRHARPSIFVLEQIAARGLARKRIARLKSAWRARWDSNYRGGLKRLKLLILKKAKIAEIT